MIKNKRGEMTTQQIVVLVILIASFAVLLFFLFRLNLGNQTEKEICHNSVVARGSSMIPTEGVPLECSREYVCITEDGSCEAMTKPVKYKVKTKEEIYDVLANEMVDCWWVFGEGKVNYVGKDLLPQLYCSLCSQIAFDDSIKKILEEGEFDKKEFYQYLSFTNITGQDRTYAEYLFGTNDIDSLSDVEFGKINLDNQYYVLTGITSKVSEVGYIAVGGALAAGLILSPLTGGASLVSVVGVLSVAAGGAAGHFIAPVVQGAVGNDFISPSLIEVNSDEFDALECKQIATLS